MDTDPSELRNAWVEFPGLLGDDELRHVTLRFEAARIMFRVQPVAVGALTYSVSYAHALHIRAGDVTPACRILRDVCHLEDPEQDEPASGTCPACQTDFADELSCPSCGINLGSRFDPDDPRIVFVREHGGFMDPPVA